MPSWMGLKWRKREEFDCYEYSPIWSIGRVGRLARLEGANTERGHSPPFAGVSRVAYDRLAVDAEEARGIWRMLAGPWWPFIRWSLVRDYSHNGS